MIGLPGTLGQHDVVLPPLLILRDRRGDVGLATVLQHQPESQMPLQVYANYAKHPQKLSFSFRVEPLKNLIICIGVYSGVCSLLSDAMLDA